MELHRRVGAARPTGWPRCVMCHSGRQRATFIGLVAAAIGIAAPYCSASELPLAIPFHGPPGTYTVEQWKRDWPGCAFEDGVSEGRVSLRSEGDRRWLRVLCRAGEIGPERGGAGWRQPFASCETAELNYRLRFDPEFDFGRGGKLPGLAGGPGNITGGRRPTGENGFSVRLMWRKEGRGEIYVYHLDQRERTGDSLPFPAEFRFPRGVPLRVRLLVSLNTPGEHNGIVRAWGTLPGEPEQLLAERRDLCWRTVDAIGIDGLYFQTFHGGSSADWAPRRDCWIEYTDFNVHTPQNNDR